MLDQLTATHFVPLLNQLFIIQVEGAEPIALELVEVTGLGREVAGTERPFSLLFLGPVSRWYLPQQIYRLEHEHIGVLELFLVPLGPQAGRMRYEAIFN